MYWVLTIQAVRCPEESGGSIETDNVYWDIQSMAINEGRAADHHRPVPSITSWELSFDSCDNPRSRNEMAATLRVPVCSQPSISGLFSDLSIHSAGLQWLLREWHGNAKTLQCHETLAHQKARLCLQWIHNPGSRTQVEVKWSTPPWKRPWYTQHFITTCNSSCILIIWGDFFLWCFFSFFFSLNISEKIKVWVQYELVFIFKIFIWF